MLCAAGNREKNTAREHATSSAGIATEHVRSSSQPNPAASLHQIYYIFGRKPNCFLLADTDVNKIVALLLWMSQDFAVDANMSVDEIEEAVIYEKSHSDVT